MKNEHGLKIYGNKTPVRSKFCHEKDYEFSIIRDLFKDITSNIEFSKPNKEDLELAVQENIKMMLESIGCMEVKVIKNRHPDTQKNCSFNYSLVAPEHLLNNPEFMELIK